MTDDKPMPLTDDEIEHARNTYHPDCCGECGSHFSEDGWLATVDDLRARLDEEARQLTESLDSERELALAMGEALRQRDAAIKERDESVAHEKAQRFRIGTLEQELDAAIARAEDAELLSLYQAAIARDAAPTDAVVMTEGQIRAAVVEACNDASVPFCRVHPGSAARYVTDCRQEVARAVVDRILSARKAGE